ncbi:type II toxin-antitoxin system VapC family toxin [Natronosporangium hydrolyticum]|uniref:Type II toxin-antitoxin system VapC family toxin n=1 Tax=Natronosporangium hydrolyticum TaxID=2811111 RepID=A0A895YAZ3_9ACTN|nr:type II toxin-antitoxin system VapC family toxin [Natronosporangium hydrolyticum]QSB13412.1 type II toxin-antitoxin system VapC family toxin [Natronosporangium hydrolyticum]
MSDFLRPVPDRRPDELATLVDSNILLDVLTEDPTWSMWSSAQLAAARDLGVLVVNPIVYAEVSVRFARIEDLDEALPAGDFLREELPYSAGFLAGKAYLRYRRQGGVKQSPIADFYIGAHAAVCGYRLLTRDAARFRTYFPKLTLVAPDDEAAGAESG